MIKSVKVRKDSDGNTLVKVWLKSDSNPEGSAAALHAKFQLLEYVAADPALTNCSGAPFETLKMYWDKIETCWVIEVEAKIPKRVL